MRCWRGLVREVGSETIGERGEGLEVGIEVGAGGRGVGVDDAAIEVGFGGDGCAGPDDGVSNRGSGVDGCTGSDGGVFDDGIGVDAGVRVDGVGEGE